MTTQTATSTWQIDGVHSIAEFAVKHMMVATVKGRFRTLGGTIQIDEAQPERSSVTAEIETASVDTGQEQRDTHLRSDDFFNAERFPAITFRSTRVQRKSDDEWKVEGDLTIRDVTRPVTLDVEFDGQIVDAYGKQRAAFSATTRVNRKDFGLNWNVALETGGWLLSDTFKVSIEIQAAKQG